VNGVRMEARRDLNAEREAERQLLADCRRWKTPRTSTANGCWASPSTAWN
jgi:hypothetical protein